MKVKKPISSPVMYKRDKGKVEITGEPEQVKWQIWFDLVSSKILWLVLLIVLLSTVPKAGWLPVIWQWVKKHLFLLTLLLVREDFLLVLLSG